MKILHCVESYAPALGGMQEVVKQLSERLVKLGHEVTVATRTHPDRTAEILNGVRIKEFDISGNYVNGYNGNIEPYKQFLLESDFEVITFFAAQQWATDIALPILPLIRAKKVSVPTGYSGFFWPGYADYFERMKEWIRGYDMNVYLSNDYRDINFARNLGIERLCVIPNGAGEDEFSSSDRLDVRAELGLNRDTFLLLHVGTFSGWKGQKTAMRIFMQSKLKNAALLMIGNLPENFRLTLKNDAGLLLNKYVQSWRRKKKVIAGSFSREFTVAAYKQANLFLFPSNIECSPIVLFECAAAGLPFLATDVGNSTEIAGWTGGGLILPTYFDKEGYSHADVAGSVRMLNQLFDDHEGRKLMSERSKASWRECYSWEQITLKYETLYADLIAGKW